MAGASIDHMVSLTILIAALLVAMMSFNQMFSTAVAYETNTQVATKAVDIMNTVCISPGNPANWGETNDTLLGFGLQDPDAGGYRLSPYSIMRLNTASDDNQVITYNGTSYNTLSTSSGHAMLVPIGDCVNYTTTAELLGINGTYGFDINIAPTLNVVVTENSTNPLALNVTVHGSGLPLSGATLNSYLFYVNETDNGEGEDDPIPFISLYSNITTTSSSGVANIEFTNVTNNNPVYSFVVYVSLGGLNGVGSYSSYTSVADNVYIVPLVEKFEADNDGNVTLNLVHSWDTLIEVPGGQAEVKFNSTFYVLTSDFRLQEFDLNCSGHLNSGSQDFATTEIPSSEVGLLVLSYRKSDTEKGSVVIPWGVGALDVQASFGGGLGSGGSDFVATEVRQVTIDGISYQVKVSAWKLGN